MNTSPFSDLRVLEFTHAVLGPTCGLIFADMGAEVIRIEPPGGDPTRRLKGFGMGYYPYFNRNKKSLAVDLKNEEGKEIVSKLLETADIVIENFGPGTMDRLGFGYEKVSNLNSKIIYASLKGFLPGPYEKRMALDEVVQMMSGLAYMTGPPGQPLRAGASVIDMTTGMFGAMAIMAALRQRELTGEGQLVRTALFETAAFLMGHHMAYSAVSGQPVPPMPARVSAWAVYHQFEVSNGERVFIGVTSDKQWVRFCAEFDRVDLVEDGRLATNNGRIDQREWLLPELRSMIGGMERADVLARCERANLPFSPIARPEELFTDPQLIRGNSLLDTVLPGGEETKLPRLPFLIGENHWDKYTDAPEIGAHSQELLLDLGYSMEQIQAIESSGIVTIGED